MEKQITIEPRHFDEAIKAPWHVATCLLAQAAKEHGLKLNDGSPNASILERHSKDAAALRKVFDTEWGVHRQSDSHGMRAIRKLLPLTVIIPESELA